MHTLNIKHKNMLSEAFYFVNILRKNVTIFFLIVLLKGAQQPYPVTKMN